MSSGLTLFFFRLGLTGQKLGKIDLWSKHRWYEVLQNPPRCEKAFKNLKDDTFQIWSDPLPFSKKNDNDWRSAGMLWRLTDCKWLTQVNPCSLSPSDLIDLLHSRCPFIRRYSQLLLNFYPLWIDWSRNDIWDTFIQFEIYFRSDWNISSAFIDRRPRIKILFQIIFSQTLKYFSGRTCNGI